MKQAKGSKGEVIMAGIGGMGVLVAGKALLRAASQHFEYVSYFPAYGMAKRGGLCECTVVFSEEKISSPLIDQAQALLLLDSSQFGAFEPRVRPGGIIVAEKAGLQVDEEKDYKLYAIPGMEVAVGMGASVVNNLIMLGAYASIADTVPVALLEDELRRRFAKDETLMSRNLDAFKRGVELGSSAAS